MKHRAPGPFGARLKALRETAGYTQDELAAIAGLSVHAVSALERGERRRPQVETVRALSAALDLTGAARDAFVASARTSGLTGGTPDGAPLPRPLTGLVGRDADVATLRQWLTDSAIRLVTLVGPGGVGKTRLALQLAHAVAEETSRRVRFVSLAAGRDSTFVAQSIGEALGLTDVNEPDLCGRARVVCRDAPTLLILDNFEHVLASVPLVAQLLITVPAICVLATSRASLGVRGEREYAVGPLALNADGDSLEEVARSPAVRVFIERVGNVRPDFRLTSENSRTVAAICRRLDGLPLALELAARWMNVLTADELLRRLDTDVLLSAVGARDLPERQQTMNATVAWSYQLLEPAERRAFRRFGALPGFFSIEAAADVLAGRDGASDRCEAALRAASGLIEKSLLVRAVTVDAARPLYYMLETVRAYAALELAAAREREDTGEGLVRYGRRESALAAEGLVGPAQVQWLGRVSHDLETYRTVLAWLIERGRSEEAAEIAWRLIWFWTIRGRAEGLRWYDEILQLSSIPPLARSRALVGAALVWFNQAELERARDALTRAYADAQAIGDLDVIAWAEDLSGRVEHALGNLSAARAWFTRLLERSAAAETRWVTGHALTGLARVVLAAGDAGHAARLLDEAAPKLRSAGPWFQSRALHVRAILAARSGNADEVIALVHESLTHVNDLQDKYALVYFLVPLAAAAVLEGDDAWVARILGARDAISERTGTAVVLKVVHDLQEQAERNACARLGQERWSRAYAAGRTSSIDSILHDIDCRRSRGAGA